MTHELYILNLGDEQRREPTPRRTTQKKPALTHIVVRPDGQTITENKYQSVEFHDGEPTRFTPHDATCIAKAFRKHTFGVKTMTYSAWKKQS